MAQAASNPDRLRAWIEDHRHDLVALCVRTERPGAEGQTRLQTIWRCHVWGLVVDVDRVTDLVLSVCEAHLPCRVEARLLGIGRTAFVRLSQ